MTTHPDHDPTIKERVEIVDARLEYMSAITQRIAEQQEINTHQLGLLIEKIDSLTVTVTTGFDELKAITRQQAETVSAGFAELKAITREQSETARQQAESVARLAATVERQAQIVERLLPAS
jgi:copper homeostasis protein CutC